MSPRDRLPINFGFELSQYMRDIRNEYSQYGVLQVRIVLAYTAVTPPQTLIFVAFPALTFNECLCLQCYWLSAPFMPKDFWHRIQGLVVPISHTGARTQIMWLNTLCTSLIVCNLKEDCNNSLHVLSSNPVANQHFCLKVFLGAPPLCLEITHWPPQADESREAQRQRERESEKRKKEKRAENREQRRDIGRAESREHRERESREQRALLSSLALQALQAPSVPAPPVTRCCISYLGEDYPLVVPENLAVLEGDIPQGLYMIAFSHAQGEY